MAVPINTDEYSINSTQILNIYKATRTIKKTQNSNLYNALKSIYEDSIFVAEIQQLWPQLPMLANLRCGLWYSKQFHSACYFKSTDGHNNNWAFSTNRLNLHVTLLAAQEGGCFIVDSTRKGKRFPDSLSKTIPIWTCVLNRGVRNYRKRMMMMGEEGPVENVDHGVCKADDNVREPVSLDWDCSLHLPLWVSAVEKASIEERLDEWTRQLEDSGADIASLALSLKKPLRPLWISQRSVVWLNEVPDHESWDFTPIILVSASASTGVFQQRTSSQFSWIYIPGAGDDEESWARGLTPSLFWSHAHDLMSLGPELCNQKVAEIVEKDRVYRAQRGQNAPQVTIKSQASLQNCKLSSSEELPSHLGLLSFKMSGDCSSEESLISWLGSTNIAVGATLHAAEASDVDSILNCDKELLPANLSCACLYLPILSSKYDRFSLLNSLPSAVRFARSNLIKGKTLLVCCNDGEDISICVCLAILIMLFDEQGSFDDGKSFGEIRITKWELRRRLVSLCKYTTKARPSRGNLKQVYSFLTQRECDLIP